MKKHPLIKNLFIALTAIFFFTACQEDVYVTPEVPETPEEPSTDINWSTYKTTTLSVTVDDEFGGQYYYTVEAYATNPATNPDAKMIAGSGQKTNSKLSYNREIVIPDAVETLYVLVTDPFKRQRVYAVGVQEGSIRLTIENQSAEVRSDYQSATSLKSDETPDISYAYGDGYIELLGTGKVALQPNNVYVVKAGTTFSGELAFGAGNVKVYVEGTLVWNDKSSSIQNKSELYILDGAVLKSGGKKALQMVGSSVLAVQAGGAIGESGALFNNMQITDDALFVNEGDVYVGNLKMTAGSKLYNDLNMTVSQLETRDTTNPVVNSGVFNAGEVILTNGTINNLATFNVSGSLTTNGATIDNSNTFTAKTAKMTNGTVNNSCMILVESLEVSGTTINITAAGYIYAKNTTKVGGMTLNMDQNAIWDGESISFTSNASFVNGGESGYALFRVNDIVCGGNRSVTYSKKVEVEFVQHTANGQWSTYYILNEDGATMTDETASVSIPASTCNNNTGNNNEGEGEGDDSDEFEEPTTLPYLYMFEDQWPQQGDYDMNDIVMSVEIKNTIVGTSTTGASIKATLYAVGGTIKIGAAFQLDGIAASNVQGAQAGLQYAVMPLFTDAHEVLGSEPNVSVNTYKIDHDPVVIEKEIAFSSPVDKTITINNFNLFLLVGGDFSATEWKEIHLPGFKGTERAVSSEFSTSDYRNKEDGWMWGLCVPQGESVYYPLETIAIDKAYDGFTSWTNGEEAPGWYYSPKAGKVITFE